MVFIKSKNHKILILIAITMCFLCSSCSHHTEEMDSKIAAESIENMTKETESLKEETLSLKKIQEQYPEKKVLTWVYNDIVEISPSVNLEINNILVEEECSYVIYFEQIAETIYENTIRMRITEKNAPDLLCASVGEAGNYTGTYRAYLNDWFLDLEEYLNSSDGKKLEDAVPIECWEASKVNGKRLGISTMLPTSTDNAYYINKSIMEKYNFDESDFKNKKIEQLGELLALLNEGDDCCELDINFNTSFCGANIVVENRGYQSDAIVVSTRNGNSCAENVFELEGAKEWFCALANYEKENYLPKEQMYKSFFISVNADNRFDQSYKEMIKELLRKKYKEVDEIVVIPYETRAISTYFNSISGVCKYSNYTEEAEDALRMIMTNRKISDLLLYGIKDVDYTLNSEKKIINSGLSWLKSMYFGNTLISTPTINEPQNKENVFREILSSMKKPLTVGKYVDLSKEAKQVEEIQAIVLEYSGLWKGAYHDVEKTLEEVSTKLKEADIDAVLEKINSQLR